MKKIKMPVFFVLFFFWIKLNAQQNIGIGTSTPHSSSLLDVKSNNKGMLVPRINLLSETDVVSISTPAISLLVYNTNYALTDGEGFYFWNGTKWSKLINRTNVSSLAWSVTGNIGTNATTDFIGTIDNKPLIFKTNNILSGKIDPGPNNVFLGQYAGAVITSGVNNTFIGHIAGAANSSGSDNLFVGHFAGNANTSGAENVFLGQDAGKANIGGARNVFVGEDAGAKNTSGSDNVFLGNGAGGENTSGFFNAALGSDALNNNISGSQNVALGQNALFENIDGINNSAIGFEALKSNSSGSFNAAVGSGALKSLTTSSFNSAFGYDALKTNSSGMENSGVGFNVLANNTTGSHNSAFGVAALYLNSTGDYNVGVGMYALGVNVTGNRNTAIGYFSGPETQPYLFPIDNTTAIGSSARVSTSNTMAFGDAEVHRWAFGISTTNANHALEVGEIVGDGNGAYLTQGGTWTNASDVNKKEDFTTLNGTDLLQKISSLPITKWRYKGSDEYHIGPMAQDFHKLFGLGTDDKGISTVDPAGISLAAIQELIKENRELKIRIERLEQWLLNK